MANKRLFSMSIVDTDAFLDMPQSSQLLYFHIAMRADDEGFVGNPKKIMRMIGSGDDDFKVLCVKKFLIPFDNGVCVVKHWLMHNTIRMDRFNPTTYQTEKAQLMIKENKSYKLLIPSDENVATIRQPNVNHTATQVKLIKVNLSKVNLERELTPNEISKDFFENGKHYFQIFDEFKEKIPLEILQREVDKFSLYWTEKSKTGKKERWEMEKTFEVKRRLFTWLSKVREFNNSPAASKGRGIA